MASYGFHIYKDGKTYEDAYAHRNTTLGIHCKTMQIFTHGPRSFNEVKIDSVAIQDLDTKIYVHSSYMSKLDKIALPKYAEHFVAQFNKCMDIGALGLVVHIPKLHYKKVAGHVQTLYKILGLGRPGLPKLILEMSANVAHPDESYESPAKIDRLINELIALGMKPEHVGICIDTAHIYASGAEITSNHDAMNYINELTHVDWIALLHLNGNMLDTKLYNKDKHAIPLAPDDFIWKNVPFKKSGCIIFLRFAKKYNIDIIIEAKPHNTIEDIKAFVALLH